MFCQPVLHIPNPATAISGHAAMICFAQERLRPGLVKIFCAAWAAFLGFVDGCSDPSRAISKCSLFGKGFPLIGACVSAVNASNYRSFVGDALRHFAEGGVAVLGPGLERSHV